VPARWTSDHYFPGGPGVWSNEARRVDKARAKTVRGITELIFRKKKGDESEPGGRQRPGRKPSNLTEKATTRVFPSPAHTVRGGGIAGGMGVGRRAGGVRASRIPPGARERRFVEIRLFREKRVGSARARAGPH
jgi:hypothetical protein